jgi:hypothetical protein
VSSLLFFSLVLVTPFFVWCLAGLACNLSWLQGRSLIVLPEPNATLSHMPSSCMPLAACVLTSDTSVLALACPSCHRYRARLGAA